MQSESAAGLVREWLAMVDERRFADAAGYLADGWINHGPDGIARDSDGFIESADKMFSDSDLRLVIHSQVAAGECVATQLSWIGATRRLNVLRLDVVREGRVVESHFEFEWVGE